jgi:hypothetical protein
MIADVLVLTYRMGRLIRLTGLIQLRVQTWKSVESIGTTPIKSCFHLGQVAYLFGFGVPQVSTRKLLAANTRSGKSSCEWLEVENVEIMKESMKKTYKNHTSALWWWFLFHNLWFTKHEEIWNCLWNVNHRVSHTKFEKEEEQGEKPCTVIEQTKVHVE